MITKYNLNKDEELRKAQEPGEWCLWDWFLKEALHRKCPWMKCLKCYNFPLPLPEGYFEPIGILYRRYKFDNQQEFSALIDSLVDDRPDPDSPAAAAGAPLPRYPTNVPPVDDVRTTACPKMWTNSGCEKSNV